MRHLPRYLQGALVRLEKLPGGGLARDARFVESMRRFSEPYRKHREELPADASDSPAWEQLRWAIEE